MIKLNQKRLRDVAIFTALVVAVQILLAKFVYPLLGQTVQQVYSISPATALTSQTIGNKIIALISGIFPLEQAGWMTWVGIFIGAFIAVWAGFFVYDQKWAWHGKNQYQRIWAILFYGTAVLYAFLLVTNLAVVATLALPLAIGLAINYAVIAVVAHLLAKQFPFLRV